VVESTTPRFLITGRLSRDFILLPSGKTLLDVPGGNVLYTSVGMMVWDPAAAPSILARVGEDFPQRWLADFARWGIDTRGVRVLPEAMDLRYFAAFTDWNTFYLDDPVVHFSRLNLPFPKVLLDYQTPNSNLDSRTRLKPYSLRQGDIASDLLDALFAHLCPVDYLTHNLMPAILRQAEFTTITLDPSPGYMNPTFWDDIPSIITGLTAFLPSEEEIRFLFQGRSTDLWEMAEALASYGCEIIVIKRSENGQLVYDAASHSRWEIPPYPARMVNPMGAGDAFCGGFLAGYHKSYEPLQAALYGNISASLVVEGDPPNFALDALPGLADARLDALRASVLKV
jgi:sugar/nucleoside kinase (ribokinase family)